MPLAGAVDRVLGVALRARSIEPLAGDDRRGQAGQDERPHEREGEDDGEHDFNGTWQLPNVGVAT